MLCADFLEARLLNDQAERSQLCAHAPKHGTCVSVMCPCVELQKLWAILTSKGRQPRSSLCGPLISILLFKRVSLSRGDLEHE